MPVQKTMDTASAEVITHNAAGVVYRFGEGTAVPVWIIEDRERTAAVQETIGTEGRVSIESYDLSGVINALGDRTSGGNWIWDRREHATAVNESVRQPGTVVNISYDLASVIDPVWAENSKWRNHAAARW